MKRTSIAAKQQTQHPSSAKAGSAKAAAARDEERAEHDSEKTDDEEALSAPASFPGPAMGNRQKQRH